MIAPVLASSAPARSRVADPTEVRSPPPGSGSVAPPGLGRGAALFATAIPSLILLLGALLRIRQYLADRSLWLDEALFALSLIGKAPGDLLAGLAYNQTAPFGFLALELASLRLLGTSEYALRLVPLLAGLVSLPLFLRVARGLLGPVGLTTAAALFACSASLTYYAAEAKSYALDVAVALALYALVFWVRARRLTLRPSLLLAGAGLVAVWFSHPAAFVLAVAGGGLLLEAWVARDWPRVRRLVIVGASWLLSFLAAYLLTQASLSDATARYLARFWGFAFPPWPPSAGTARWLLRRGSELFQEFAGLSPPALAAALFGLGLWAAARRRQWALWYLIAPAALVLVASIPGKYPFFGRLLLFLVPGIIIAVARGVELLWQWRGAAGRLLASAALGLLLAGPLAAALQQAREPQRSEEIAPVLRYLRQGYQAGDTVYLFYAAQYAFTYYVLYQGLTIGDLELDGGVPAESIERAARRGWFAPALVSRPPGLVVGEDLRGKWNDIEAELKALGGQRRVWVVFSHTKSFDGIDEQAFYLDLLDRMGQRLDAFTETGAAVYLYALADTR